MLTLNAHKKAVAKRRGKFKWTKAAATTGGKRPGRPRKSLSPEARIAAAKAQVLKQTKIKISTFTKIGEDMQLECVPSPWKPMDDWLTGKVSEKKQETIVGTGRGLPKGRIIEILGPESTCKTTLTLQMIAHLQEQGYVCAFIDVEHAFDPGYAKALGVNLEQLILHQPDSAEQALELMQALAKTKVIDLVVLDSVAALDPEAEQDKRTGKMQPGLQARLMSQACRKLTNIIGKTGTSIIFINQVRMKIGMYFGNPEDSMGGKALKFYSSIRIELRRKGTIKSGVKAIGTIIRAKTIKNKVAQPFREVDLILRFGRGVVEVQHAKNKKDKGNDK